MIIQDTQKIEVEIRDRVEAARKDERNKVLDNVKIYVNNLSSSREISVKVYVDFIEWLYEYRRTGEQGKWDTWGE
jgi:hypothetical protein